MSGDEQEEDALRNQERALEEIAAGSVHSRASQGQSQANEVLNSMPSERLQSERQSSAQYNNPGDLGEAGENEDPNRTKNSRYGGSSSEGQGEDQEEGDSDDNNYEVCFVVQDVEFFTFKENFIQQSKQFRDIVDSIDDTQ